MEPASATGRLASGHRQFYTLPKLPELKTVDSTVFKFSSVNTRSSVSEGVSDVSIEQFCSNEEFFEYINRNVIGYDKTFSSVFGDRKVIYCDYIASGRSLSFIEDFIYNEVLPDYGNTHTMTSVTSLQTTMYRHEAKDIVRNAVRASDYDAVFFVGSGCTGAVHKLIHNLHMDKPPIVVTGPFEHHSNMLPWRHLAEKIVRLSTDECGNVSYKNLEEVLLREELAAKDLGCPLIVCLAAASNVTGILVDVDKFSALVHRHGGLVFWDYATAAPYVKVDMNPVVFGPDRDLVYKDAVYFSMHKFVGGVQTPGVLIAKRVLFKAGEKHPDGCGGGSVCFVRRDHQVYLKDVEEREEGGTPAIVESIRAGLVMQLKESVSAVVIFKREEDIVKRAWSRFKECPNLMVLGGDAAPRLPIFSVVVRHVFPDVGAFAGKGAGESASPPRKAGDRAMFLHHTFVAALLNDLFGIQCRAGCVCAGPYAMDLLGIDENLAKHYEDALVTDGPSAYRVQKAYENISREVLRPGFTRFSIPYFMSDEEVNFVLEAVCFVADYGWAFLPLYSYDAMTGEWKHRQHNQLEDRQWLGHIKYGKDGMIWRRAKTKSRSALPKSLKDCLQVAKIELKRAVEYVKSPKFSPVPDVTATFDEFSQKLRWFVLPCEAAAQMRGEITQLAVPTGPSSPWIPGTMDPCTNASTPHCRTTPSMSYRQSCATSPCTTLHTMRALRHPSNARSLAGSVSPRRRYRKSPSISPLHRHHHHPHGHEQSSRKASPVSSNAHHSSPKSETTLRPGDLQQANNSSEQLPGEEDEMSTTATTTTTVSSTRAVMGSQICCTLMRGMLTVEATTTAAGRLASGCQQFYTLPVVPDVTHKDLAVFRLLSTAERSSVSESQNDHSDKGFESSREFLDYINRNVVGYHKVFTSVFGERKVVYCDYIASGRSLSFIEDFIYNEVLPTYGNTHTLTSITSMQTTMFRHEAKDIVRNAVRASDSDAVFFVGSGCTGAVHKLIHNLHLEKPPIVITGPFEHHSNMLPWRHLAEKIVRLSTDSRGNVSHSHLEEVLQTEEPVAKKLGCSLIVCLAAASNVTGILVDVDKFSTLVHRHGGLVFWDYATAAPYVKIDMNPVVFGPDRDLVHKDAVYFSMHKFVGGVQTPGVLIAKRVLFKAGEKHPDGCGGGSVCFVRRNHQVYLKEVEEREEGGTPAIVESIRAGLVMQLKQALSADVIFNREEQIVCRAWARFKGVPNLLILGGDEATRLPIFSMVIGHVFGDKDEGAFDRPVYLHHAFVASLLNDLFGIQCRAGCVCAGPYAMDLLGIDENLAKRYEDALVSNSSSCGGQEFQPISREVLRPGFTRFSVPFFMPDDEVDFVFEAVCFIAEYGWNFLPLYNYSPLTGEWKHRLHEQLDDRQWLTHVKYTKEGMTWCRARPKSCNTAPKTLQECLEVAHEELQRTIEFVTCSKDSPVPDDTASFDGVSQQLRWFLLPCEAAAQMRGEIDKLSIPTGPSSPWVPGTMDPCTNAATAQPGSSAASSQPAPSHEFSCPCLDDGFNGHNAFTDLQNNTSLIDGPDSPNGNNNQYVEALVIEDTQQRSRQSSCAKEFEVEDILKDLKGPYLASSGTKDLKAKNLRFSQKDTKSLWRRPFKQLYKPFLQAIKDFGMIREGDRVLVCLSGGKDSLSLLHCLHAYQETCLHRHDYPSFEIGVVTIDPGSSAFDPHPLIPYLAELGVEYLYEEQEIMKKASDLGDQCSSICSFCSRMKRGRIYAAALRHGYNVVALGQHLDDLAERWMLRLFPSRCLPIPNSPPLPSSFIMSIFHNGALNTMKAHYLIQAKNLRVIRPFVYVREKLTRAFAEMAGLPAIPENCPACFQMPKERMRVKRVLSEYESRFPDIYASLQAAMLPLVSRGVALGLSGLEDAQRALDTNASNAVSDLSPDEFQFSSCS